MGRSEKPFFPSFVQNRTCCIGGLFIGVGVNAVKARLSFICLKDLYETYFYQLWPASDRDFTAMVQSSRKIPLKIAARCEGTVSNLGRRFFLINEHLIVCLKV